MFSPWKTNDKPAGAGRPPWAVFIFLAVLVAGPGPAAAIGILDLVHDTPATRQRYKMDIAGFTTETAPGEGGGLTTFGADKIWQARQKLIELGESEKADEQIKALLSWRADQGRRNLLPYASVLVREAVGEASAGNAARAQGLLEYAERLAPDYPPVYLAGGYVALRKNWLGLPRFITGAAQAAQAMGRDPAITLTATGRLAGNAALTLFLMALIWAGAVTVRYFVHLKHDLEEILARYRRLFAKNRAAYAWIVVAALAVLWASPLWIILACLFFSWTYQSARERTVSLAMGLAVAVIPLLALIVSWTSAMMSDPVNQALFAFQNGSETALHASLLEEKHREMPADALIAFVLAQQYWRRGDPEKALPLYAKLRENSPLKAEAAVNQGNVLYSRGDLKGAADLYREATAAKPGLGLAHFNLGQVLNLQFQFQEGEEAIRKAQSLDNRLMQELPTSAQEKTARVILGAQAPPPAVLRRAGWMNRDFLLATPNRWWPAWLSGLPWKLFPAGVLLLVVMAAAWSRYLNRRGLSRRCVKCGRPYCPLCLPGSAKTTTCPQCQHIFVVKEGVESAMRLEKMMEIKSYQSRRRRIGLALSALLPGGGPIYYGSPVYGLAVAAPLVVMSLLVLGWQGPFVNQFWFSYPWQRLLARAELVALLFLYLLNMALTYRWGEGER